LRIKKNLLGIVVIVAILAFGALFMYSHEANAGQPQVLNHSPGEAPGIMSGPSRSDLVAVRRLSNGEMHTLAMISGPWGKGQASIKTHFDQVIVHGNEFNADTTSYNTAGRFVYIGWVDPEVPYLTDGEYEYLFEFYDGEDMVAIRTAGRIYVMDNEINFYRGSTRTKTEKY